MKKMLMLVMLASAVTVTANSQLLKKIGDKVKDKTNQKADQTVDKNIDKSEEGTANTNKEDHTNSKPAANSNDAAGEATSSTPTLKAYQNFDFVPGDKILFEDHFTDDQDGEFPSHWELKKGQAQLNKANGELAFF